MPVESPNPPGLQASEVHRPEPTPQGSIEGEQQAGTTNVTRTAIIKWTAATREAKTKVKHGLGTLGVQVAVYEYEGGETENYRTSAQTEIKKLRVLGNEEVEIEWKNVQEGTVKFIIVVTG